MTRDSGAAAAVVVASMASRDICFSRARRPLIRALHAYVCWRIAAGAVGWAWLLLGLATDRLGATNAFTAAIHVTAVRTRLWSIVNCSVAAFWLRHHRAGLEACGYSRRTGLSDCPMPQRRSGARVPERAWELGVSWTRACVVPRRARAEPGNLARAVALWTGPLHDDGWDRRTDA